MYRTRVLGISLGARRMGIAIVENLTIIDCRSKVFNQQWSPAKCDRIVMTIKKYLIQYRITSVALKVAPRYSISIALEQLIDCIKNVVTELEIEYSFYSAYDVIRDLLPNASNAQGIEAYILDRYNLKHWFGKTSKENRYKKQFEAIAVAELKIRELVK